MYEMIDQIKQADLKLILAIICLVVIGVGGTYLANLVSVKLNPREFLKLPRKSYERRRSSKAKEAHNGDHRIVL